MDETSERGSAAVTGEIKIKSACARLIGASSNILGREFRLTRQTMSVGRSDDNDVVIRCTGVSRAHAKIRREAGYGDGYTISDLQSTNGIYVNGQSYGKVELRNGDYIDIGQVRLYFVAPGRELNFSRDVEVLVVPTSPLLKSKKSRSAGKTRGARITSASKPRPAPVDETHTREQKRRSVRKRM